MESNNIFQCFSTDIEQLHGKNKNHQRGTETIFYRPRKGNLFVVKGLKSDILLKLRSHKLTSKHFQYNILTDFWKEERKNIF